MLFYSGFRYHEMKFSRIVTRSVCVVVMYQGIVLIQVNMCVVHIDIAVSFNLVLSFFNVAIIASLTC